VQDLGEDAFPEPKQSATTPDDASSRTADLAPESTASAVESSTPTSDKAPLEPPPPPPTSEAADDKKSVTTNERKPMEIPSSVHVRITPDNLKDYVGPPVYQKDRLYTHAPPPGVSTGLGYLGNGSGAVMPIEAMVTLSFFPVCFRFSLICFYFRVCQEKEDSN
jgi:ATP-dependent Lon protease